MVQDQRQKKYVDPAVQGALSRRLIWHWCLFLVTAAGCALLMQVLSDPFQPFSHHLRNLWWTQGPILLVGACLVPVFVNDTIKLSHRFVGPLSRIRMTMRKAGAANIRSPSSCAPTIFGTNLPMILTSCWTA